MQPLENKNDKATNNEDKRSFIPFKRSKNSIKFLLLYRGISCYIAAQLGVNTGHAIANMANRVRLLPVLPRPLSITIYSKKRTRSNSFPIKTAIFIKLNSELPL